MVNNTETKSTMANEKKDLFKEKMVEYLKDAILNNKEPWKSPCFVSVPRNAFTNKCYRGRNALILRLVAQEENFSTNKWATFKQYSAKRIYIGKGETGQRISFFMHAASKGEVDNNGELEMGKEKLIWRYYTVFNMDQTNMKVDIMPEFKEHGEVLNKILSFLAAHKCEIKQTENGNYFIPATNTISINTAKYNEGDSLQTIVHESMHALRHYSKTALDYTKQRDIEEIIVDCAAWFVVGAYGIKSENTFAYASSWLAGYTGAEKERVLVECIVEAQKMSDMLLSELGFFAKDAEHNEN
jgi:antirestriction protein ArdC